MIMSLYAAPLAFLYIALAFNVIRLRFKYRVSLGTGEVPKLERAIRAHGNFAEYVPFTLLLIGLAEYKGAPLWLIHIFGILLLVGRLLHSYCLCVKYITIARQAGILMTFIVLLVSAGTAFYLAF